MGGIITTFVGISIDAIVGTASGVLSEYIFSREGSIGNPWISAFEGLLQLTTEVLVAGELSSILTPTSYGRPYGVVLMMYFALMASPNMRGKISTVSESLNMSLMLPSGGLYSKIAELQQKEPRQA